MQYAVGKIVAWLARSARRNLLASIAGGVITGARPKGDDIAAALELTDSPS